MGSIRRKTFTKPLPPDAEIVARKGERFARWKVNGKTRTAKVTRGEDGRDRIVEQAATFTAKYRDGQGRVREVATGCRDATAARQILANLEKRADGVRSGIRTAAEDAAHDHQASPLPEHCAAYLVYLQVEGTTRVHRDNVTRCLNRVATDCRFASLSDLNREALESWLVAMDAAKMGARTRNTYRSAIVAFANWCVETDRLAANPLAKVEKADEASGQRRKRRAMTEAELVKLLDFARRRPLLDAMTIRRGKRKGQTTANVRGDVREHLDALGRERALIYKTLLLTGLRKSELASITVGQLELEGSVPFVVLAAADEKNRDGSDLPLRADLAADLRDWLADRLRGEQQAARSAGAPIPQRLPAAAPLFTVPAGLIRILDRDLKAAGIPKRDERGRTLDVHALRHSFITHLSKGGVAPRTAQAAARHSDIKLTMQTYTDPKLLDIHGALRALPAMPLAGAGTQQAAAESHDKQPRATGDKQPIEGKPLAPLLAPDSYPACPNLADTARQAIDAARAFVPQDAAVSVEPVKRNSPLTTPVNGLQEERATGLGPATSSLGS